MNTLTFNVVFSSMQSTERALQRIAKRAAKRRDANGQPLPVPTWSWGARTTALETHNVRHEVYSEEIVPRKFMVERIALTMSAEPIRFAGWTFVASITHMTAEDGSPVNWISNCPGEEAPSGYRDAGSGCDHCRANRRRNNTYILRREVPVYATTGNREQTGTTSTYMQVGSTCIGDFLGGGSALDAAARAELFASLRDAAASGESFGGSGEQTWELAEFLTAVSVLVREDGWVSRTKARESEDTRATVDSLLSFGPGGVPVYPKVLARATESDMSDAAAAVEWAGSLSAADTDANDYLHKCNLCAQVGNVNRKMAGVAASILPSYMREVGRRRLAEQTAASSTNAYIGTVGASKCVFGDAALFGATTRKGLRAGWTVLTAEPMTLTDARDISTAYGVSTLLTFRTAEGHTVKWFASSTELTAKDVGSRFHVKGSIKKHAEWRGAKETTIARADVLRADAAPAALAG